MGLFSIKPWDGTLRVEEALMMIYCLMAVDGVVAKEELEEFDIIGRELIRDFDKYKDYIIKRCVDSLGKASSNEKYQDNLRDFIRDLIVNAQMSNDGSVPGKMLIWNLISVAYSEGDYGEEERSLISFITCLLLIDKTVPEEMDYIFQTVRAIDKEVAWLKSSCKPFAVVEKHLNELSNRRKAVMDGLWALVQD